MRIDGRRAAAALLLAAALQAGAPGAARAERVTIFAAASVTDALDAAIAAYRGVSGDRVVAVYAASSVLARQIEAGAPAALFLSASAAWMDYLEARGLVAPGARAALFGNRLALAAPPDSTRELSFAGGAPDLAAALEGGRLAIADPDHAPAGIYARQALRALGLWSAIAARTARAGDARAATALVARGEAALGIVYRTDLAACPRCRELALLPAASHAPIVYPLAPIEGNRTPAAEALFAWLRGARVADVFREFGFLPLPAGE